MKVWRKWGKAVTSERLKHLAYLWLTKKQVRTFPYMYLPNLNVEIEKYNYLYQNKKIRVLQSKCENATSTFDTK